MAGALGWGALAASSLLLGAVLGCVRAWSTRPLGALLGFGAGALLSAISFELFAEGFSDSAAGVTVGLAIGAVTYVALNRRIERRPQSGGSSLALGAFLDGIPEQLALGLSLVGGSGVSAGLLLAVFVSNLPEAIGSASEARESGTSRGAILRLWTAVVVVSTAAAVIGYVVLDTASAEIVAGIQGFAAGALIAMLVDTMIPDATRRLGESTGLFTALGFAVAALISATS